MSDPANPAGAATLVWGDDGVPRSRHFGDIYFSAADGLAESRAVFLRGCGLPEAWRNRPGFVVGELGFGSGLNVLALLDLWRRERPARGRLHVFTVEAYPLSREDAARALAAWPEIADLAALLLTRWPGRARGFHRVDLPELCATVDLAVMDVADALAEWTGEADAWFLDGFSPALNPGMWGEEVLAAVAARSAPGARLATFTVAGGVRRGLAAAGFDVARAPGFGRKRERLEARLPGAAPRPAAPGPVAVIGAGIAGAAAARAVRALGGDVLVVDRAGAGAGASGNPAALVAPRLDASLLAPARLFAQSFARATGLYRQIPGAVLSRGALQLACTPRDPDRFARIAASGLFEPGALRLLDAEAAAARLGEAAGEALAQDTALVIDPAPVLAAWLGATASATVERIERAGAGWALLDPEGGEIARAAAVVVAAGPHAPALAPDQSVQAVRGQVSWAEEVEAPAATAWGGYVAPARQGLFFGATHDREDRDVGVREADHARNLETLRARLPALAARLEGRPLLGRAALRATTRDRLPLAGPTASDGVFVLAGLGGRGFSLAPLLAEHVAALALGAPSPLPTPLAALVDPGRFRRRALRRQDQGER